jgi:FtsP/CotA-like multicopper oxidase with cupredoxin domain
MQSKTTRRSFVKGLAATGLLGGLGMWRAPVWAVTSPGQPNVLSGNEFDLYIGELPVNITGQLVRPWPSTAPCLGRSCDGAKATP